MTVRIGLVGAGFVSSHHLIGWLALTARATIVAVADTSFETASAAGNLAALRLVEDRYRLSPWRPDA